MRKTALILAAALGLVATSAAADTIDQMLTYGIVLNLQGTDVDVTYTPDGKFTAFNGQVTGTWRRDGDKLCSSSTVNPTETCTAYPADKKAGDSFEVQGAQGPVTIKINPTAPASAPAAPAAPS